jgi:outer membrane protein assembly factor BamB
MRLTWPFAAALLILAGLSSGAFSQEWTRFRGPNGAGISDTHFPPTFAEKDFAWKITLPGGGHSSPVLWGDKLFITCADDETGRQTVMCISAKDGSTLWRRDFDSHTFPKHQNNSFASGSAAVDADRVYICSTTPEALTLFALDHNGGDAWHTNLGPFVSQHGGGQSPTVVGDVVLLPDVNEGRASFLFGIDRKTGHTLWQLPVGKTDKFCPASPCMYQPPSGAPQAIFMTKVEGIMAVDPQSGQMLWKTPGIFDARAVGSPVIWHDQIFGSCGDGPKGHQLASVRIAPDGKSAAKVWVTEDDTPYVPTMLLKHDLLFCWGDNGILTCRRPENGKIVWQQRVPATYYGSPVCAGDTIYTLSRTGDVVAIAALDKYQLLGKTPLGELCHTTPAIAGGKMFIRTYTHLYCVAGK